MESDDEFKNEDDGDDSDTKTENTYIPLKERRRQQVDDLTYRRDQD